MSETVYQLFALLPVAWLLSRLLWPRRAIR